MADILKAIERPVGVERIFDDFLVMSAVAIANRFQQDKSVAYSREERYLETVGKYGREDVGKFVRLGAELVAALESCIGQQCLRLHALPFWRIDFSAPFPIRGTRPRFSDMLGEVATALRLPGVAVAAGETLAEEFVSEQIKKRGFVLIQKDTSTDVFKNLNKLLDMEINPRQQSLVIAGSLGERLALMMYVQLSYYGIPAVVTQQDTDAAPWYTPMYVHEGWADRCES